MGLGSHEHAVLFAVQQAAETRLHERSDLMPTLATSESVMPLSDTLPADCRLSSNSLDLVQCAVDGPACNRQEERADQDDWKCELALPRARSTMAR
jgi:hypothetical protein